MRRKYRNSKNYCRGALS